MPAVAPLLLLFAGALAILAIGIFLPRRHQGLMGRFAAALLAAVAGMAIGMSPAPPGMVLHGALAMDGALLGAMAILALAGLAVVALSLPWWRGDAREAEYYALLLLALLGALLLAGSADLMQLLMSALLSSVAGCALTGWRREEPRALEAMLKYYLFGALTQVGLLLGLVLLFGLTGSTAFAALAGLDQGNRLAVAAALTLLIVGLGFKGGYVPAHFWVPDVYQGASLPVAALLSVIPKAAVALAMARVAAAVDPARVDLPALLALVAAATITWGNLAALRQEDLRRLLGYSSIAQAGNLLLASVAMHGSPLATQALLFGIAAYAAGNLTVFAALAASGATTLAGLAGLSARLPWVAFALGVGVLSLLGLPPLAGFVGKFLLFTAVLEAGFVWLTLLALANTALSLIYYLRVIAAATVAAPAPAAVAAGGVGVVEGAGGAPEEGEGPTAPTTGAPTGAGSAPLLAVVLALATVALGLGAVLLLGASAPGLASG